MYVYTFFIPRPFLVFLLFSVLLASKKRPSNYGPFWFMVLANFGIAILLGGDHFALHRFLLPALPFLAIITVHGIQASLHRFISYLTLIHKPALAGLIFFVFIITLIGQNRVLFHYKKDDAYIFSKGARWLIDEAAWAENWKILGLWLKQK